ncbi:hypothetical protein M0Q50_04940 [bacterium]|jgi:hypothetical protein|nr:hypothetical protein [bacterium]
MKLVRELLNSYLKEDEDIIKFKNEKSRREYQKLLKDKKEREDEDLTKPYETINEIPFISMVNSKMKSYLIYQSKVLISPRLLEYTSFLDYYNGACIPIEFKGTQYRKLGLLTYDDPISLRDLEHMSNMSHDSGFPHYKMTPNFTIFKDWIGNNSAAWGDVDKIEFLIDKFSDEYKMRHMTKQEHRNLGNWFGYKPEEIEKWIKKTYKNEKISS